MGIRIDGNNDLIKAVDDTLTIEGISVNTSGMVTATGGVKVGTAATIHSTGQFNIGVAHTLFANGNATHSGIVTASSFVGDGSGLTNAGPSLTGSTNNTVVTVTGSNAIQGESNLTFDGDTLLLKSSTDGRRVSFAGDGTSHYMKYDNTLGGIILNGYGGITFETNGTNERLRITSGGKFGFGTNSPYTHGIATFNDVNGIYSGHVRIYQNVNNTWTKLGSDIDGEAAGDNSGKSVSLSSDGSVIAIGAKYNDGNGSASCHVRIYKNVNNTWTQVGGDIDGEACNNNSGSDLY